MAQIIEFPKDRLTNKAPDQKAEDFVRDHVREIVGHYGVDLLRNLKRQGFDTEKDDFIHEYVFVLEILRTILHNNKGVEDDMYDLVTMMVDEFYEE